MKLSTRSRYGLRAMHELALNYNNGPVSIKKISEKQDISSKYLHALLTTLKSNGLVRSIWGSQGGFLLTSPPAEIKLYDIVKALEGPISVVDCVDDSSFCPKTIDCVTREIWVDVSNSIESVLSNISLDSLVKKSKKTAPKREKK